tara:strand:+ start:357 stop:566 length:210 start_codon:yes stop_codon:yes gene_type:complete
MQSNIHTIYKLIYYEGDERHILYSVNKVSLENLINSWEKEGFGVGCDSITKISFTDEEELVDQLNDLED